jgi:hypothetical protein
MNEDDLLKQVVAHLNRDVQTLPIQTLDRLRVARQAAIVRAREKSAWSASGHGALTLAGQWLAVRFALPILILMAGVSGVAYWHYSSTPQFDHAEIEAGLLSDELPITAYLDTGFDSWLEETAQD